jgi:hypothetical protein
MVGVALAVPVVSSAQVPTQDSVLGRGVAIGDSPTITYDFEIDARSGPGGENPTGHVSFIGSIPNSIIFDGPVTCLSVNGNMAGLNVSTSQFGTVGMQITDSPTGDLIRAIPIPEGAPCSPLGFAVDFTLVSGDIAVADNAPILPTSREQCQNGGWRSYGVFKNQGDCVSFVATGGKNPPPS